MKKIATVFLAFSACCAFAGFSVENGPGYKTITFPPTTKGGSSFVHTIRTGIDGPVIAGKVNTTNPIGKPLVIDVESRVVKSALPGLFKKALRILPVVNTAVSLMELADELGYEVNKNPSSEDPLVEKVFKDGGDKTIFFLSSNPSVQYSTPEEAADAGCKKIKLSNSMYVSYRITGFKGRDGTSYIFGCSLTDDSGYVGGELSIFVSSKTVTGEVSVRRQPSSLEEFVNDIANHPKAVSLPPAIEEAVGITGDPYPFEETPTVSGPSTTDGTSVVTKNPDGSTTTTNTTYGHQYNGNTINTTTNSTTTTVNNNNQVTNTTTTSTTPPTQEESSPTDTPLPDKPKLYERKYPDGLEGVWRDRKEQMTSSSLLQLAKAMSPTISGSGGCPQFVIPAQIGPLSFGTGYQGPPCWIWDFCKAVVLLSAAFLARALIFGG